MMQSSSVLTNFEQRMLPLIDETLTTYLDGLAAPAQLRDAMKYSVMAGGKRIRPLLVLATAASCGRRADKAARQVAASLELLHTYSLIHDDLPAMDDDDLRRGKPTNHKKFGEAVAILAGDGLLTAAFDLVSRAELPTVITTKLVSALARAAGPEGMVAGQTLDVTNTGKKLTLPQLQQVHRGKTGALIKYACYAGAVLSDQSRTVIDLVSEYGAHFGLAFQIYDDILDVTGTQEQLGKAVNKDATAQKNTYPGLLGMAGAQEQLTAAVTAARRCVRQIERVGLDGTLLGEMLRYFEDEVQ